MGSNIIHKLLVRFPYFSNTKEDSTAFPECVCIAYDCLCGLVVKVPGYRLRGPGSSPGATRFSEK
jgi:hypothetical protein